MKAFASDLDGTLYFNDLPEKIKAKDIEAIKKWQQNNNLFGVCTGRPLSDVDLGPIDLDFYIVSSGALVLDKNQQVIHEELVSFDIIKTIFDQYNDLFYVYIQGDKKLYCTKAGTLPLRHTLIEDIDSLKNSHLYGISINALTCENAKKTTEIINQQFGDYVDAYLNVDCIDIVNKGCSKGSGLKRLKEKMQITYLSGIGDSYNDLPMFAVVDQAFTFNRSPEKVKQAAKYLVDGIDECIEKLLEQE